VAICDDSDETLGSINREFLAKLNNYRLFRARSVLRR
jgi:hypothetical protein